MFLYPNRSGIPSAFITTGLWSVGATSVMNTSKMDLNIETEYWLLSRGLLSCEWSSFCTCKFETVDIYFMSARLHLVKFWLCIVPRCHTRVNRQGQWRYISMMMVVVVVAVVVLMMVAVVLVVVTMKTMLVMITRTTQSRLRHHGVVVYLLTVGSRFANSYIVRYVYITPSFLPIYIYVVYAWFSQVAHRSGSLCFWIWLYWVSSSVLLIWIKALAMALFFFHIVFLKYFCVPDSVVDSLYFLAVLDDVFLCFFSFVAESVLVFLLAIFVVHPDIHHAGSCS